MADPAQPGNAPAGSEQGSRVRDENVRESGAAPLNAGVASVTGVTSPKGAPVQPSDGVPASSGQGAPALVIRGLRKEYRRGVPVLRDIDLTIANRGITAVIGPSGTGKSTLIRCINRLVEPTAGEILFQGLDLAKLRGQALRAARRRIGMVFQEYNLVERLSVMENVLSGRLGYVPPLKAFLRHYPAADIDAAFELLDTVGLTQFANQRADALSGGQRLRVGMARAIMQQPELLLADEPTSSLDPKTSVEIMELLAALVGGRNIPVILNIHNVPLARRFATHMIGMTNGTIVYDGAPEGLTDEHLRQIYGGESWLEQREESASIGTAHIAPDPAAAHD